jgi:hypothetical protein
MDAISFFITVVNWHAPNSTPAGSSSSGPPIYGRPNISSRGSCYLATHCLPLNITNRVYFEGVIYNGRGGAVRSRVSHNSYCWDTGKRARIKGGRRGSLRIGRECQASSWLTVLFFFYWGYGYVQQAILLILATPSCGFKGILLTDTAPCLRRDLNPRPFGWESDVPTIRPRRSTRQFYCESYWSLRTCHTLTMWSDWPPCLTLSVLKVIYPPVLRPV